MARLQTTLPEPIYAQLQLLGEKLGLSVNEVGIEACSLFVKAAWEIERGHRVVFIRDEHDTKSVREFSSPALLMLEMAYTKKESIVLPEADFDRLQEVIESPPDPNPALRALAQKSRQTPK